MHQPDSIVIQTNNLSKSYNGVEALKSLNLTVPRHSIFGFLGPNGAGKSTAMKLLLGLIRPTAGTGTVFGHDIVQDSMAIRARTGYLAQQPHFYEEMTARETLRLTAEFFFKGPKTAIEERVREMLHLVGLEAKADRMKRCSPLKPLAVWPVLARCCAENYANGGRRTPFDYAQDRYGGCRRCCGWRLSTVSWRLCCL